MSVGSTAGQTFAASSFKNRLRISPLAHRCVPLRQWPSVKMNRDFLTETVSSVPDRLSPALYIGQVSSPLREYCGPQVHFESVAPKVTATQLWTVTVARVSGW